ncbi:STAS domain-containing protein [Salicibibacter halophilus]|uniref:STAS domain-containing protein n=1 Tax=Salicibibacter halophilus TaxID=2502791 RepID=A0A514LGC8_9BACI|nr:STAS domain-containing protein [Salicibibacter halophilus]QDI90910.1 STAS domain-containing protein [Salicibibacter halophilus]
MAYRDADLYKYFFNNLEQIVARIVTSTSQSLQHRLSHSEHDLHQELLNNLLIKIKDELDDEDSTAGINLDYDPTDVLGEQGYDIDYIVTLLSQFRLNALKEVEVVLQEYDVSLKDTFYFMYRVTEIFDQAIKNSTKYYNTQQQSRLKKLEEELLELSAPIVPVKEDVSVLPIVGSMSEERADHIIKNVIPKVSENKIGTLILDFSAIHILDTFVASRLFTITRTLKLLGIRTIITGIRPEMAQTTIELGIEMDDIEIYRDVKRALEKII